VARQAAVVGWTAAALVVSSALAVPACGGHVTGEKEDTDAGPAPTSSATAGGGGAGAGGTPAVGGDSPDAGEIIVIDLPPADAGADADEPIHESGIC
jgi:hypothetical protein